MASYRRLGLLLHGLYCPLRNVLHLLKKAVSPIPQSVGRETFPSRSVYYCVSDI
jgi:hypothetical protein